MSVIGVKVELDHIKSNPLFRQKPGCIYLSNNKGILKIYDIV